jgi:hypothetical protein
MANPGRIDLELIEVQTGSYLGEDDIVRLQDVYNRGGQAAFRELQIDGSRHCRLW